MTWQRPAEPHSPAGRSGAVRGVQSGAAPGHPICAGSGQTGRARRRVKGRVRFPELATRTVAAVDHPLSASGRGRQPPAGAPYMGLGTLHERAASTCFVHILSASDNSIYYKALFYTIMPLGYLYHIHVS